MHGPYPPATLAEQPLLIAATSAEPHQSPEKTPHTTLVDLGVATIVVGIAWAHGAQAAALLPPCGRTSCRIRLGLAHRGHFPRTKKSRKSRPNETPLYFSDAVPHDVLKANRTKGRRAMIVGYARTSTWDQTAGLAAQQRDLKAAGAEKVFSEQASSVAQRTKLNECLAFLRDGDALTVTKPDRLARSTTELLSIEADLSKRGVGPGGS